ncbi:homeobox protein six1 [Lasius niger]|uniref:Homeobox protein six1 n=1 Tax=Lasius niger TaxID=67767 RepID=A0A0J7L2R4_LASNI|nr:homeobox protein six1 [Lasius niger]
MKCPKALLDGNSAGDYSFIHGDKNVTTNKVYYDDCASKIIFTLQESQEPAIDDTIEQVRTDNLSTVIAARNVDSLPPVKSESKTPEINQQRSRDRFKLPDDQHSQEYDISSQSRESQDYTHKDSVSNTTVLLQQQLRCILQTPAIISKPLSSSFEILEQSNTTKRWRECTTDTTETSAISAEIDHRSFSTLIPDIVLDTDVRKTTKALYSSCGKSEKRDLKQGPSCEKQKRKCETTKKDETKRKCVKGPAKCLSRKSIVDKAQTCQSTKAKDEDKKLREPTQKYYNHAEYCANRKIEPITKDKKPIGKAAKEQPSITVKDEKPTEESIKKQIEREYKEIDECKKKGRVIEKKEKKPETTKKAPTEYKPTGLDRVISPCKQEGMKDSKKFASMPNESIFSNFMGIAYKMLNVRSNIINGEIPIIPKDIKLLNVMFDRSFSTTKVSYQDDFAIKRTTDHSKTIQNCSANNSDFIHGDESPNYIEIENDDEEEDDYDWIIGRPTSGIN